MTASLRVALATCLVSALALPAAAEWRRLDSPNFVVVGDVSARELRSVAVKFEGFRETLSRVLGSGATAAAVPTVVIVFPNDKAFTPFKPTYQGKTMDAVRGIFVPRQDVNYIAMETGRDSDERVLFHEYAHLVIGNVMPRVPIWLNEGLAEFYSTFRLMDDGRRAQIGVPIAEHLRLLQESERLLLPDLLKVDRRSRYYNEGARATVFYAESWALTHLILNGEPPRTKELAAYLQRVGSGTPEDRAWEEAFGSRQMDQAFREYLRRLTYRTIVIDFTESVASFAGTAAPLPPAEADAFLAGYLLARHEVEQASAQLAGALRTDAGDPYVSGITATIDIARQQYESAEKRLLGGAGTGGTTTDWFAAYLRACALAELMDALPANRGNDALVQAARQEFEGVQQARPDLPNVLAHLVSLELQGDGRPAPAMRDAIAKARQLAPGRFDYAFLQAETLGRLGDFTGARTVLGPLMSDVYPADVRDASRRLMGVVVDWEQRERAAARRAAAPVDGAGSPTAPAPAATPAASSPSTAATRPRRSSSRADGPPAFKPDYRPLGAGESRLDGILEAIDCRSDGVLLFRVEDGDGGPPLVADGFKAVSFISYRDDLRGSVNCGPFKPPTPVRVTWREGDTTRRERVVVAIEFPPKD